jgi:hypothetical protein
MALTPLLNGATYQGLTSALYASEYPVNQFDGITLSGAFILGFRTTDTLSFELTNNTQDGTSTIQAMSSSTQVPNASQGGTWGAALVGRYS